MTAAAALLIAYGAFSASLVNIVASANPKMALSFDANSPVALVAAADALALRGMSADQAGPFDRMARSSVSAQALNPRALRLLAMTPDPAMRDAKRWALLDLSQRLSRREIGTQLLLIEKYAQTDAIAATLKHYDLALTTDQGSRDTLFPILAAAIEDPAINKEFSNYLASHHPWIDPFIRFKLETDKGSNVLVDAANAARVKPQGAAFAEMKQHLFERSVRTGNYAAARTFQRRYAFSDASLLTSASFSPGAKSSMDAILRWRLFELPYMVPEIGRSAPTSPYRLSVATSSSARGTVAAKLLLMPPGRYRVDIAYGDVKLTSATVATWTLRCIGAAADSVIWSSNAAGRAPTFSVVAIPSQCGAQDLELALSSGPDQDESILVVNSVKLVRVD